MWELKKKIKAIQMEVHIQRQWQKVIHNAFIQEKTCVQNQ